MSLIKHTSGVAARAAVFRGRSAEPAVAIGSDHEESHAAQLARLHDRIAALEAERTASAEAAMADCATAFERGRTEGLEQAETREEEGLAALCQSVEAELESVRERLASERDLAVEIAQAALARVLGDAAHYRELVAKTADHHAEMVLQGALVELEVSGADFPDDAALATLPGLGRDVTVVADPSLDPGTCRFSLSLGALDASIPRQAAALNDVLEHARQVETA